MELPQISIGFVKTVTTRLQADTGGGDGLRRWHAISRLPILKILKVETGTHLRPHHRVDPRSISYRKILCASLATSRGVSCARISESTLKVSVTRLPRLERGFTSFLLIVTELADGTVGVELTGVANVWRLGSAHAIVAD